MVMTLPTKKANVSTQLLPVKGKCDSCSSPAEYQALKGTARLIFCGHHTRKNSASLTVRGFQIHPDSYHLKPGH